MYSHIFLVTSVRGLGDAPITAASAEDGVIGFMNAAFGLRFVLAFVAFLAGDRFLVVFFFAVDFLVVDFFFLAFAIPKLLDITLGNQTSFYTEYSDFFCSRMQGLFYSIIFPL